MTNRLNTEARQSQDVDVIQQAGAGLLNGMSHVLDVLTKNEPTDAKQIGKAVRSNKHLENFDGKLNKVRGYILLLFYIVIEVIYHCFYRCLCRYRFGYRRCTYRYCCLHSQS